MLHQDDFDADVSHVRDMENWFRALVRFPGEEEISGDPDPTSLRPLLTRAAAALVHDTSIMPGETFEHVRDMLALDQDNCGGSRYCDVAEHVGRNVELFL